MSSQLITAPDFVDDGNTSILIMYYTQDTLELVITCCRNLDRDFNIYLCDQNTDAEWYTRAIYKAEKIFKNAKVTEICDFLTKKNAESYSE